MRFVIDTLEESFHCVFVFDNVNLTLDIFEREIGMLGNNRGLVVADDTYATSINYSEDTSGIKTRIFVFGKNQATIAKYNPTGQLYIDDFSFYMTTQYMTQELIDALTAYKNLVRSQYGVWEALVDKMDAFFEDSPDLPLPADLLDQMNVIINLLAWQNNFTPEQIKQIASFIKEDTININTIENGRELYRFALRHIQTTAFVPIQISIDCIDVLALEDHQREWLKFRVGDFANIYREEHGLAYKEMRLISYEHNPIQNTLRLEFSNRDELVTMRWLNNMFFYRLGNLEDNWNGERDWYIRIPTFNFNSPELINLIQNIVEIEVDNSLEVIFKEIEERVFNQIVEVFETEVLAADTAHILNAWIRFLKVDMLETNFEALDPRISWPPGAEPFVRYFVRIAGITIQHIRATLSPTEIENYRTPSYRLPDGSMSPGDQIYWTAIGDHPQAFKYFTITDPISVFVNGVITVSGGNTITVTNRRVLTNPLPPGVEPPEDYEKIWRDLTSHEQEQVREMFRVKVRSTLSESVRKTDAFEYINNPSGTGQTMIPKTIWGGGNHVDPSLTNGRGYQYKDWNGFNMTYTTRTGYGSTPAGTEIGIRLQDDGCYYFDMEENEWLKIGSGSKFDGSHIIMPRLPVQAEIDLMPIDSVVLVYDPNTPFIPES